jgi:predicted permease
LDFVDFQQRVTGFSGLAADATNESALDVGDGRSQVVLLEAVSFNYAQVMGVKASVGRWFANEDERGGDPFQAVISYRAWQSRLGGSAQVIGRRIRLESQMYTVTGVAPKEFPGMAVPVMTEVWVPLHSYAQHNKFAADLLRQRQGGRVMVFGRLQNGAAASPAQAQLQAVDRRLRREYAENNLPATALRLETVRGTSDPGYRRMVRPLLALLGAVVGVVLLITCANVANLLLARGLKRRGEVSIRIALGASRGRICRQMLAESLLLSLLGAGAGLAAVPMSNRGLARALAAAPSPEAIGASLTADGRVLGFVLLAAVATTMLCGLIPALQSSKPDLAPALKGSEVYARNRRLNLRNLSAVGQVTFSLVLLILAGLFLRALESASRIDPGFETRRLLSARLYISPADFNQAAGRTFYRHVLERVRAMPGVRNATLSYASPTMTMSECVAPAEGSHFSPAVEAGANVIGANYFSTFGITVMRGRDFQASDQESAPPVVMVNETLARRYWRGQDPIGRHVRVGQGCEQGKGTDAEIIGIVKDARYATLEQLTQPYVFLPMEQRFAGFVALVMQTEGPPDKWAEGLRKELRGMDGRLQVFGIEPISTQMDHALWQTRWEASLLGGFGLLALAIAAVGLYGVVAFTAGQRTREFGIRMALGAQERDILRLVTGDGLVIALTGITLGATISLGATGLLRSFLYGLSPTDGTAFAGAAVLWLTISVLASATPAYRAMKVDPVAAIRHE